MKKILTLLLILALTISLAACRKETAQPEEPVVETPVETPDEPLEEEVPQKDVTLYFANEEYIQTGDESLDKMVVEIRTIDIMEMGLEELVVRSLMEGPTIEGARNAIPSTVKLNGVEVKDNIAYVDFASEGMHGGSLEETYTINQIVASILALDTVDKVQFLLDGEPGVSLMGHYGIEKPFDAILGE